MECEYGMICSCSHCEYGIPNVDYFYDCQLRIDEEEEYQRYIDEQELINL